MKNINASLGFSGFFLIIINLFIIYNFGIVESRFARFSSIIILFLLFLYLAPKKEKFLTSAFGLFVVSDLLLIEYEIPFIRKLNFILVILAYSFLIIHIAPYVKNLKTTLLQKVIFAGVLAINTLMLYFLVDMVETRIDDIFHSSLFYIYGIAIILLIIYAFSFSHRYSNKASFFFICAAMGFVFSDISGFIAYYMEVGVFYFPDRLFYLLGLLSLVKFSSLEKEDGMLQDPELL